MPSVLELYAQTSRRIEVKAGAAGRRVGAKFRGQSKSMSKEQRLKSFFPHKQNLRIVKVVKSLEICTSVINKEGNKFFQQQPSISKL